MADDGSGNFTLPSAPFVAGTTAVAADVNANFSDIATALTARVTRNGSGSMSGNLAMGTNKVTGLGAGTARTDAAQVAQIQDGGPIWGGTAGGTADALTLTLSPAITAYATGQVFRFISSAANTGAATINVNSVGTKNIRKSDGSVALDAADIPSGVLCEVVYDGTQFVLTNVARTEAQARDAIGAAPLAAPAFTGNGSITGGLTVSGAGGLSVVNGASVGTALTVTGAATIGGAAQFDDDVTVDGTGGVDAVNTSTFWVSFAGADGTIRSGFNVTSVTRNSAGDYTITFTTALASANYAFAGSAVNVAAGSNGGMTVSAKNGGTYSTAALDIEVTRDRWDAVTTTLVDADIVNVIGFGG